MWALAALVGIGFVVSALVEVVVLVRFHHRLPYRRAFIALALMTLLIGVVALVWPGATILVLAVLLSVRVLLEGVVLTIFGLGLRKLATI